MDAGATGDPGCLSDELLVRLSEGRLAPDELARALRHAAGCDACHDDLAAVTPAPWEPPEVIGEFRLLRELGHGGMGVVHLAHDAQLDRQVALKFIAGDQPEPRVLESFEDEARLLARLQHPNVVTVFRVGQVDGHPYIVSEYVVGKSLARLEVPLPWHRVLELGLGLARGLAAAHRQGVLHRDLKPSNAIETTGGVVKLLDFGLAVRADGGSAHGRTLAGTPRYMAPEVLAGAPATARSDLYSLGLVLQELSTGALPRDQPARPEPADPDLQAIIDRCTQPDPDQRFASADLLCEALERLAARVPAALSANPYRGLSSFEPEHQALFFGRDADIVAVLERLQRRHLVLVMADSGVGKSSLCRAGVLPRVAAGALGGGRRPSTVVLTPGRRPLQALAAALSSTEGELANQPEAAARRALAAFEPGGVLLFVDQLEELVTLGDPEDAACFARFLGELVRARARARVLLTVRGDFFTRVATLPGLGEEAEHALYFLRPMTPKGLRAAIVGPARACGVTFESEALIHQLVESAAHGSGELPLLSFALTELWERRDVAGARITRASLEEMGGVAGVLSRHADHVVARLDQAQQQAARRILLRLVTAEDTRGERSEGELEVASESARVALRALVDGRLLQARTVGGRVSYQISHDALIQRWPLLRNWLDDDIGHRAVQKRLEAASTEWSRLHHPPELLWQERQLDEARPLEPEALGSLERRFLGDSRRRLTRRRRALWIAAALIAAAIATPAGLIRRQAYLENARFVEEALASAAGSMEKGRALARTTGARREEALAAFDREGGDVANWNEAEERWASVLELREQAVAAFRAAEQSLEHAQERELRGAETRQLLREVTYQELELEERFHPQGAAAEEVRRLLTRFDDEAWRARVEAPAQVAISTRPAGARLAVERYADVDRALRLEAVPGPGPGGPSPDRLELPPGSYRLRLTANGRSVVFPLLLTRGARERIDLALPADIPEGFAYVPPGWFLEGSDQPEMVRRAMHSPPLHRVYMPRGYFIGRSEVTFRSWVEYLRALPPGAPDRQRLEHLELSNVAGVTLQWQQGWRFSFYRSPSRTPLFTAREGEPFRYPARTRRATGDWMQLPLSGISAQHLSGYLSWLDGTKQVPGARLCNEREWERAARGADARSFPGGERLAPDDANIDVTYGREQEAYGPDPVGSHPASASPFEVNDMAGNILEMTTPWSQDQGPVVIRGGGWYYQDINALILSRDPSEPTFQDPTVGARVCASSQE